MLNLLPNRCLSLLLCLSVLSAASPPACRAKVLLSQKEALALAFPPGSAVERKTAFLTPEQARLAQSLARAKLGSRLWTYYVGASSSGARSYAYFDRVIVRTLPATVMAALDAEGRLRFLEILSFEEPEDYLPTRRWLDLFKGKNLGEDLRVRGGIRNVAGASLSAQVFAESARRMLAVHQAVHPPTRQEGSP